MSTQPQPADYLRGTNHSEKSIAGFTIIEVLIVMALAGLILLIVFLALPVLQRNSRNTGRKEDAGRIVAAITNFIANNNGVLPADATWNANCMTIMQDAGNLNQYGSVACAPNNISNAIPLVQTTVNAKFWLAVSPAGLLGPGVTANTNVLLLDEQAVCSSPSTTTGLGPGSNSAAFLYDLESGGSNWVWNCQNIE